MEAIKWVSARWQAAEQRWRWCEAIKKGRVWFVCPWCTHQGVITRQYWSDELRGVISLLRLHSASRSVCSVMPLSTPTSPAINPAARTADTIIRGNAPIPVHIHTCWAPHWQSLQGLALIKTSQRGTQMLTLMLLASHFQAFWFDFVQRWQQNGYGNTERIKRNEVRLRWDKDKGWMSQ